MPVMTPFGKIKFDENFASYSQSNISVITYSIYLKVCSIVEGKLDNEVG